MTHTCTNSQCLSSNTKKAGFFYRRSDSSTIQRYKCLDCNKTFSQATGEECFLHKKRQINKSVFELFASGVSQNRMARILAVTRKTIVRKLKFLGSQCARRNCELHQKCEKAQIIAFDELETFEHTRCKPLSIALAVENKTRRILGFKVSTMPAKGRLAKISRKKYGKRKDQRSKGLKALFEEIDPICAEKLTILSDMCPTYEGVLAKTLGKNPERIQEYQQFRSARSTETGLGELKKLKFDPLFYINHTLAMLRANINRLFRRTWNTTKKMERLVMHLEIYVYYHNRILLPQAIST